MLLINGREVSNFIVSNIEEEVKKLKKINFRPPHLAIIIVGDNKNSLTYVNAKIRRANKIGFETTLINLENNILQNELIKVIRRLNNDKNIDGFIVQLPLPKNIDKNQILMEINPKKDVDGFHPLNFGKAILNIDSFVPATPSAILSIIKYYKIPTKSKRVVVIGRSQIVGLPISILLSHKTEYGNSTVTIVHSHTTNLKEVTTKADIIIVAIGIKKFLKADMVKEGVVVIDVGISKENNNIWGDVDFDEVSKKASYITPVPGGVGPVTISMLLKNTLKAYLANNNLNLNK